jgi:hypothetical protein
LLFWDHSFIQSVHKVMRTIQPKAPLKSAHGDMKTSNVTTGTIGSAKSKTEKPNPVAPPPPPPRSSVIQNLNLRASTEGKVVGLGDYGLDETVFQQRRQFAPSLESKSAIFSTHNIEKSKYVSIEEMEDIARYQATRNPFELLLLGNIAAFKVMGYYLITLETLLTCALTVALTLFWYYQYEDDPNWQGGGMDFILLAFAVTSPISAAIGMAFQRRERALIAIADFRSFSYHLYLAHCLWDWSDKGGREGAVDVDWLEHCDAVLAQLLGIGDELARFLSLPTTSRSRHRMTRQGRKEASRTTEVAYHLLESMTTQRMTRLVLYSERLKKIGLPSGEVSRIRQFERFLSDIVEQLRMVKMYRSPQALRSFARLFTLLLPPFYAPTFAQVAREVDSVTVGVLFGIITAVGLTALFESLQVLEDPFTAFLALDGIDVREEFEVLHFSQLINTRRLVFPDAPAYPPGRRCALTGKSKVNKLIDGRPATQAYHHTAKPSEVPSMVSLGTIPLQEDSSMVDLLSPSAWPWEHLDEELGLPLDSDDNASIRESYVVEIDDTPKRRPKGMSGSARSVRRTLGTRHLHREEVQKEDTSQQSPSRDNA